MHASSELPVWKASKRAEFLSQLGYLLRVEPRSEEFLTDLSVHLPCLAIGYGQPVTLTFGKKEPFCSCYNQDR